MNLSDFFDTFRPRTFRSRVRVVAALASSSMLAFGQLPITAAGRRQDPANPPQATPARPSPTGCRVTGRALSGTAPLPGVAIVVRVGEAVRAATSTDAEGKFTILFGPSATYHVSAELMAFGKAEQDLTLGALPCDTTLDFQLALRPRTEEVPVAGAPAVGTAPAAPAGQVATTTGTGAPAAPAATAAGPGRSGAAGAAGQAGTRFQQLNVQADQNGQAAVEVAPPDQSAELARLLPPGFTRRREAEAVAVNGARRRDQRRSRHAERSHERDWPRRVRSRDGPVRGGLRSAAARADRAAGRAATMRSVRRVPAAVAAAGLAARAAAARRAGRVRARRPRRTRTEPVSGLGELHVRRIGARLDQLPAAQWRHHARQPAAVRAQQLRRHVRRPGHHSRPLQEHEPPHELPGELLGQSLDEAAGSVRDRPDRAMRNGDFSAAPSSSSIRRRDCHSRTTRFRWTGWPRRRWRCCSYIPTPNVLGAPLTQNFHNAATTLSTSQQRQPAHQSESDAHAAAARRRPGRPGGGGGGRGGGGAAAAAARAAAADAG